MGEVFSPLERSQNHERVLVLGRVLWWSLRWAPSHGAGVDTGKYTGAAENQQRPERIY
jgi:hypothetical protein